MNPLKLKADLPVDRDALTIWDKCTKAFRLSKISKRDIDNRLVRTSFLIKQNSAIYLSLLGCLIKVNLWSLKKWSFPSIYQSGIHYVEEPIGSEIWQSIPALYLRRVGDCEDLVSARVAELKNYGYRANAKIVKVGRSQTGGRLFHFLVNNNGLIEDPSKILGMP